MDACDGLEGWLGNGCVNGSTLGLQKKTCNIGNKNCILEMKISVKKKQHKFETIHLELAVANLGLISDPFFRGFD